MPQQFRDVVYNAAARGRILVHKVNASYGRQPPHYPGQHINDAVLFSEMFSLQFGGRTPYSHETLRSGRLIGNVSFTTQIISDFVFPTVYIDGKSWVASQSPGVANTAADCAFVAATVSWPVATDKSRLGENNYTQLLSGLYLPLLEYRHTQLHRASLNEDQLGHPSIGVAVGQAFYNMSFTDADAPQNVGLQAVSDLVTPYTVSDSISYGGWEIVRLPTVMSLIAKGSVGAAAPITDLLTFASPWVVSAIAIDPRTGDEWLTAANVGITNTDAFYGRHNVSLSRDLLRYPTFSSGVAEPLFSYLTCSLLSAAATNDTSGNYNVLDGRGIYEIQIARRGASVGGNTAMPTDYDTWDFAAVCKREFYSLAVYARDSVAAAPPSHQSFESPEFFRLYEPSTASIGSPMSLLPQREATPVSIEKPYYHQVEGSLVPDLRSADFSLVMLKGMSLIYQNGVFASDESSLVPVLPSQAAFRFQGHDITGTTVRFDPIAWSSGTSFGATPQAMPEAQQLQPSQWQAEFVASFSSYTPPDASGDYWMPVVGGFYQGFSGVAGALPANGFSFVVQQNPTVPPGTNTQRYDYEIYLPPNTLNVNPFWLTQYHAAQSFTQFAAWDEASYNAGLYAQAFLDAQSEFYNSQWQNYSAPPSPKFLRYPVDVSGPRDGLISGAAAWESPQPDKLPASVSAATALPMVCGVDYSCTSAPIAEKQPAAGLFSYSGVGPSATLVVPCYSRGVKAISEWQDEPYLEQYPYYYYNADVSFSTFDIPGEFTVAMNTPEVNLFVRWHASLQGLGSYKPGGLSTHFPNGIDIDDQRGSVSPFHWVRTSRIDELSPVLVAELWMTARGTADVSAEWQWPEELPELQSSFTARATFANSQADLSEFNVFSGGLYGAFNSPPNVPVPLARHHSDGAFLHDKSPFLAGVFVFNRDQTGRLLNGESVYPTRWMEYDEGDPLGDEPQLLRWHQALPATIRPSFTLQIS